MKNQGPEKLNIFGAVFLLALCWCALAKCFFGILAYLPVLSLGDVGPFFVLVSFSLSAAWMSRPGLAWPDYAAVFALIGAAYADGPIRRVGWGNPPDIEAFFAFALWMIALDRPLPRRTLFWLWPLAGAALAVGLLGFYGVGYADQAPQLSHWTWRAGLALAALLVIILRLRREHRLWTTELTFVFVGFAPAFLWVAAYSVLPARWNDASPVLRTGVNLWLAMIPLGLTIMYEYRRRHFDEHQRT